MITKEEFKADIDNYIKTKAPQEWRKGQAVFNYVAYVYGVARTVQFRDGVDCFYNNDEEVIEKFIDAAYNEYKYLEEDALD